MQVYPLYLLRDPSTLFCFSEKKSGAFRVDLWLYNFGLKARPTRSECFFFQSSSPKDNLTTFRYLVVLLSFQHLVSTYFVLLSNKTAGLFVINSRRIGSLQGKRSVVHCLYCGQQLRL